MERKRSSEWTLLVHGGDLCVSSQIALVKRPVPTDVDEVKDVQRFSYSLGLTNIMIVSVTTFMGCAELLSKLPAFLSIPLCINGRRLLLGSRTVSLPFLIMLPRVCC